MLVSTALDPDMIQALQDTDGESCTQTTPLAQHIYNMNFPKKSNDRPLGYSL